VKLAFRLGALSEVLALARRLAPDAALSSHAASGVLWLGGDLEPGTIRALRDGVTAYDGTAVVVEAPASVKEAVDVWGPVRGLAVMRRIKEQFDPERRLQQGVFVDGC
jgi:glycolate oxidase FAD binding subunit